VAHTLGACVSAAVASNVAKGMNRFHIILTPLSLIFRPLRTTRPPGRDGGALPPASVDASDAVLAPSRVIFIINENG
jgi:hypothetical protein